MASTGRFSKLDFEDRPAGLEDLDPKEKWPNIDEHACLKSGNDLFSTGEYEAAMAAYSRALRFNRDFSAAWVGQVRCLICLGEYPEAVKWSDRGLEKFAKSADLLACKGLSLSLLGDLREGIEYLDGAVQMRSPSPWVWFARGRSYLIRPETQSEAIHCFLKASEADMNDWETDMRIGMAYNETKMYARARTFLMGALRSPILDAAKNPLLLYHTGVAHEGLGDTALAIGYYERSLSARPGFQLAQDGLSRVRSASPLSRLIKRATRKKR